MEGSIGILTGQLNTFSGEIQRLLQVVEDNDTGMKQTIQTQISGMQTIETQITGVQSQISGVDQLYQSAGTALEGRLTAASGALETRPAAIEGMAAEVPALKGAQSLLSRDQVNMSDGLKSKFAEIETALAAAGPGQGPKGNLKGNL